MGAPTRSAAIAAVLAAILALSPPPAAAQPADPEPAAPPTAAQPPAPDLSPEAMIAKAFENLRSEDETVRARAEKRISDHFSASGSASMDLLLQRGRDAMDKEAFDVALVHFTDLVNLAPDFPEGWNARATAHFRLDDYGAALTDLAEAVALDARHYSALAGLGVVLEAIGDEKGAMVAFRQALEIHPHLDAPKSAVERLAPTVDGRDA